MANIENFDGNVQQSDLEKDMVSYIPSAMLKSFWTSKSKSRIGQIIKYMYAVIFHILSQSKWN